MRPNSPSTRMPEDVRLGIGQTLLLKDTSGGNWKVLPLEMCDVMSDI